MIGWLVYKEEDRRRNGRFIQWMQEAAEQENIELDVVTYETLVMTLSGNAPLFHSRRIPDFLIIRTCTPWLNEAAEIRGIRVFNRANVSRIANDKRLSHAFVNTLGVPMLSSTAAHRDALTRISPSYPYILKDPLGRGGTGVEWISRPQQLYMSRRKNDLLMQPVGGQRGKDVRVYIVGGEIVAAVLRESETNFKANISGGAAASLFHLKEQDITIVQKITQALPIDFAGIDFLLAEDGSLLFNEMEDAVGCRSLYMNSDINIAEVFLTYVAEEMR
ncbi:ATP-grasp domain-containing protein [Alkalicoccus daliensis]|uniref:Ribosomal protein S6--L-glutamate ligase n=1 Tax=Alkalicoccus daliensis TaxID=745820 RepID=A0A1H0CL85_9BACI|nr:hypothetical protein [Alkalicoccus daliensis]SDN58657.1 ribosomal protein S6--L-glutamate ligase [Alkalicoccus daliensis]